MSEQPRVIIGPAFGAKSREAMVSLRVGDVEVTMLPERARELARLLLVSAEEAESETVIVDFLTTKLGMSPQDARSTLGELRLHRTRLRDA